MHSTRTTDEIPVVDPKRSRADRDRWSHHRLSPGDDSGREHLDRFRFERRVALFCALGMAVCAALAWLRQLPH